MSAHGTGAKFPIDGNLASLNQVHVVNDLVITYTIDFNEVHYTLNSVISIHVMSLTP